MDRDDVPSVYSTEAEVEQRRYYPYQSTNDATGTMVVRLNEAVDERTCDEYIVRHFNGWYEKYYWFGWCYRVERGGFRLNGYPLIGPIYQPPNQRIRITI